MMVKYILLIYNFLQNYGKLGAILITFAFLAFYIEGMQKR